MSEQESSSPEPIEEESSAEESSIRMEVQGLMLDPNSKTPILVLSGEADSDLLLPIWIGPPEANAIALQMKSVELPRPMTHDLARSLIEQLGGRIERVEIVDLKASTFYATLHLLDADGEKHRLDSRPSDAIAIALRCNAPIYVSRRVLKRADAFSLAASALSPEEMIRRQLEELDSEDPDTYTM